MLRNIKSAWPRERRFTWRGWVLLAVFAVVAVAASRGWDPVLQFQTWLDAINHDWQWSWSLWVLTWTWIENAGFTPSVLTIGGVFVPLLLRRPPVLWWWFVALLVGAVFGGFVRVTLYQSVLRGLDGRRFCVISWQFFYSRLFGEDCLR